MLSPFPGVKISPLPCTPPIHECGSVMTTLVSHGVPVQQNMQLSRSFNVIKVKSTSRSFEVNSSRSFSHQISWLYHPEHHNVFTRSPPWPWPSVLYTVEYRSSSRSWPLWQPRASQSSCIRMATKHPSPTQGHLNSSRIIQGQCYSSHIVTGGHIPRSISRSLCPNRKLPAVPGSSSRSQFSQGHWIWFDPVTLATLWPWPCKVIPFYWWIESQFFGRVSNHPRR